MEQFPDRGRPIADGKRELVVRFGKWGYNVEYIHLHEQKKIVVRRTRSGAENRA